jgi:hypothetical protein
MQMIDFKLTLKKLNSTFLLTVNLLALISNVSLLKDFDKKINLRNIVNSLLILEK